MWLHRTMFWTEQTKRSAVFLNSLNQCFQTKTFPPFYFSQECLCKQYLTKFLTCRYCKLCDSMCKTQKRRSELQSILDTATIYHICNVETISMTLFRAVAVRNIWPFKFPISRCIYLCAVLLIGGWSAKILCWTRI